MSAIWQKNTYNLRERIKRDATKHKLSTDEVVDLIFYALEHSVKFRIEEYTRAFATAVQHKDNILAE